MKRYKVQFREKALKELNSLDAQIVKRIWPKIWALAENPRPPGCKKLSGCDDMWRIRIGDYRVLYTIDDMGTIVIIAMVAHRGGAYR